MIDKYTKMHKKKVGKLFIHKDGKIFAKKKLIFTLPQEYVKKKLVTVHEEYMDIMAVVGVIDVEANEVYAMRRAISFKAEPSMTQTATHEGIKYIEYVFEEGDVVSRSLDMLKTPKLVPIVLSLALFRSIIPYYYDKEDIIALLTSIGKFGGLAIDKNKSIIEVLISQSIRNKENLLLARYTPELTDDQIIYKGLENRAFSTDHTFRMMLGGHVSKAQRVMITKIPSDVTQLEASLR